MFELMYRSTKLLIWASLSLLSVYRMSVLSQQITTTPNTSWSCEQLDFCSDKLGFEAIEWLFRQLDDDANGNVDITESNEFLRDELKYENGYERQKAFHGNDKQITVDELWKSWKQSAVRNWTVDETVDWLINSVELPQYVEQFQHNAVDGMALPRLAANTQFISILGINNPIHKQKLALKAMDVVLFGAPKAHNYVKDVILAVSLVIATVGIWFAYVQHKSSQSHLKKMMKDMDTLQKAEEQLMGLQQELDKIREEQQIVFEEKSNLEKKLTERTASYTALTEVGRIAELEDELNRLREELKRAQTSHQTSSRWTAPHNLQLWLQLTHELEIRSFNAKRLAAESQLYAAKEGCERLRKKRSTLLGAFRVAHGNSMDDVDSRILQAKTSLSEVTKDLQERLHRWRQIEKFCGVPVIQNPGIEYLQSILYGSAIASPSSAHPHGLSRVGSETSIEEETRAISGSIANVSMAGFSIQLPSDKTSLLSINNNNSHRKHSNGTMYSNNSTVCEQSDDDFEEDIVSLSSARFNPLFSIGNSSIRDGVKTSVPMESKASNRSKMMQKSYSEDQDSARYRYERSETIEADSLCHSESCNELETCATAQKSPNSDSREIITQLSDKISSNIPQINKTTDESFESTSNDSNSSKDFENNSKVLTNEKKRSLFHGLRKRKPPKQT